MHRSHVQKWAKAVSSKPQTSKPAVPAVKKPIRVIDLPGVLKLEDQLLLYGQEPSRAEDAAAEVSRKLFGIADADVQFEMPDEYETLPSHCVRERYAMEADLREYDEQFETGEHLMDVEMLEVLDEVGFNFRDDRGQPLRCTKFLGRPAEAAAKGIKGKMPDLQLAGLTKWEAEIARSAEDFLARKRRR
jgi:hypothetical protein